VRPGPAAAAQVAVAQALAEDAGMFTQAGIPGAGLPPHSSGPGSFPGSTRPVSVPPGALAQAAATRRFLALPAAARHTWLLSHLPALRAGRIPLSEIP
jgi:hypothetical protein